MDPAPRGDAACEGGIVGDDGDEDGPQGCVCALLEVELSIRGILRGFGLKVGQVTRKTFEARIRE
jgi:hypothetical protein